MDPRDGFEALKNRRISCPRGNRTTFAWFTAHRCLPECADRTNDALGPSHSVRVGEQARTEPVEVRQLCDVSDKLKYQAFWHVTTCHVASIYRRLEGPKRLHLQDQDIQDEGATIL